MILIIILVKIIIFIISIMAGNFVRKVNLTPAPIAVPKSAIGGDIVVKFELLGSDNATAITDADWLQANVQLCLHYSTSAPPVSQAVYDSVVGQALHKHKLIELSFENLYRKSVTIPDVEVAGGEYVVSLTATNLGDGTLGAGTAAALAIVQNVTDGNGSRADVSSAQSTGIVPKALAPCPVIVDKLEAGEQIMIIAEANDGVNGSFDFGTAFNLDLAGTPAQPTQTPNSRKIAVLSGGPAWIDNANKGLGYATFVYSDFTTYINPYKMDEYTVDFFPANTQITNDSYAGTNKSEIQATDKDGNTIYTPGANAGTTVTYASGTYDLNGSDGLLTCVEYEALVYAKAQDRGGCCYQTIDGVRKAYYVVTVYDVDSTAAQESSAGANDAVLANVPRFVFNSATGAAAGSWQKYGVEWSLMAMADDYTRSKMSNAFIIAGDTQPSAVQTFTASAGNNAVNGSATRGPTFNGQSGILVRCSPPREMKNTMPYTAVLYVAYVDELSTESIVIEDSAATSERELFVAGIPPGGSFEPGTASAPTYRSVTVPFVTLISARKALADARSEAEAADDGAQLTRDYSDENSPWTAITLSSVEFANNMCGVTTNPDGSAYGGSTDGYVLTAAIAGRVRAMVVQVVAEGIPSSAEKTADVFMAAAVSPAPSILQPATNIHSATDKQSSDLITIQWANQSAAAFGGYSYDKILGFDVYMQEDAEKMMRVNFAGAGMDGAILDLVLSNSIDNFGVRVSGSGSGFAASTEYYVKLNGLTAVNPNMYTSVPFTTAGDGTVTITNALTGYDTRNQAGNHATAGPVAKYESTRPSAYTVSYPGLANANVDQSIGNSPNVTIHLTSNNSAVSNAVAATSNVTLRAFYSVDNTALSAESWQKSANVTLQLTDNPAGSGVSGPTTEYNGGFDLHQGVLTKYMLAVVTAEYGTTDSVLITSAFGASNTRDGWFTASEPVSVPLQSVAPGWDNTFDPALASRVEGKFTLGANEAAQSLFTNGLGVGVMSRLGEPGGSDNEQPGTDIVRRVVQANGAPGSYSRGAVVSYETGIYEGLSGDALGVYTWQTDAPAVGLAYYYDIALYNSLNMLTSTSNGVVYTNATNGVSDDSATLNWLEAAAPDITLELAGTPASGTPTSGELGKIPISFLKYGGAAVNAANDLIGRGGDTLTRAVVKEIDAVTDVTTYQEFIPANLNTQGATISIDYDRNNTLVNSFNVLSNIYVAVKNSTQTDNTLLRYQSIGTARTRTTPQNCSVSADGGYVGKALVEVTMPSTGTGAANNDLGALGGGGNDDLSGDNTYQLVVIFKPVASGTFNTYVSGGAASGEVETVIQLDGDLHNTANVEMISTMEPTSEGGTGVAPGQKVSFWIIGLADDTDFHVIASVQNKDVTVVKSETLWSGSLTAAVTEPFSTAADAGAAAQATGLSVTQVGDNVVLAWTKPTFAGVTEWQYHSHHLMIKAHATENSAVVNDSGTEVCYVMTNVDVQSLTVGSSGDGISIGSGTSIGVVDPRGNGGTANYTHLPVNIPGGAGALAGLSNQYLYKRCHIYFCYKYMGFESF